MRKTYYCPHCDTEFTGLISVHRVCGKRGQPAERSKLAAMIESGRPAYMGNQSVRRADKMMEREFAARKISNFSNAYGGSRVEFNGVTPQAPAINTFSNAYGGGPIHGFNQPPIAAGWGKEGLSGVNQMYGTNFKLPDVAPPQGPIEQAGRSIPWGQSVPKNPISE